MAQSRGPTILIAMWTTTSTAAILVAARIYTRARIVRKVGLDDYLITLSIAIGFLFVALETAAVKAGDGQRAATLSPAEFERAAMLNTAAYAPGILSFVLPKLGVVALLCRIFNPSRRWKIFLWTFVGGSGLIISGCIIILYAQCNPMKAMWTPGVGKCWSPRIVVDYSIFAGALSAFIDIFLASYPAVILWNLQLAIKRKALLLVLFSLGAGAAIVAIVKCTHIPGLADESDPTYSTAELVIWTNAESNTIIIAACIPPCIPLFEAISFNKGAEGSHRKREWAPKSPSENKLHKKVNNPYSLPEIRTKITIVPG